MFDFGVVRRKCGRALRRREPKAQRVVERIAGRRGKPPVPHQLRIESRIYNTRRAALVAGSDPAGAHYAVVLNTDRDRLGIAEAERGDMASGAGIIVVKSCDRVKE